MKTFKSLLLLGMGLLWAGMAWAQSPYVWDGKTPENVLEGVFHAARAGDADLLNGLCDPEEQGDGDTRRICALGAMATYSERELAAEPSWQEFVEFFKDAEISGEATYATQDGITVAQVPFLFKNPRGEGRIEETMNMVERDGIWYLLSF